MHPFLLSSYIDILLRNINHQEGLALMSVKFRAPSLRAIL